LFNFASTGVFVALLFFVGVRSGTASLEGVNRYPVTLFGLFILLRRFAG
jgi:hypothetical protein